MTCASLSSYIKQCSGDTIARNKTRKRLHPLPDLECCLADAKFQLLISHNAYFEESSSLCDVGTSSDNAWRVGHRKGATQDAIGATLI